MGRTIKAVVGICVLAGSLFITSGTVGAQECGGYFGPPCGTETLTFEYPRTVNARGPIHIEGIIEFQEDTQAARASDDTVEFVLANQAIGSSPVAADGTFEGDFTVPNVAPGEYEITASSGTLSTTGPITVLDPGGVAGTGGTNGTTSTAGTNPLARTGFSSTPMITLGLAVLVLGAAAVYGSKRRRTV